MRKVEASVMTAREARRTWQQAAWDKTLAVVADDTLVEVFYQRALGARYFAGWQVVGEKQ